MRFVIGLPTDDVQRIDEFGTAEAVTEMARHVEDLGYEAVYVTDHPAPTTKYIAGGGHQLNGVPQTAVVLGNRRRVLARPESLS